MHVGRNFAPQPDPQAILADSAEGRELAGTAGYSQVIGLLIGNRDSGQCGVIASRAKYKAEAGIKMQACTD
jgi:hypothetical protein